MNHSESNNFRRENTGGIDQRAISGAGSQQQRYASFSCYAYRLVSEHGPWATVRVLC